jgi:hypothetical protein
VAAHWRGQSEFQLAEELFDACCAELANAAGREPATGLLVGIDTRLHPGAAGEVTTLLDDAAAEYAAALPGQLRRQLRRKDRTVQRAMTLADSHTYAALCARRCQGEYHLVTRLIGPPQDRSLQMAVALRGVLAATIELTAAENALDFELAQPGIWRKVLSAGLAGTGLAINRPRTCTLTELASVVRLPLYQQLSLLAQRTKPGFGLRHGRD